MTAEARLGSADCLGATPAEAVRFPKSSVAVIMLVIHSDTERRQQLIAALGAAGVPAVGVAHLSEIEKWPFGRVVVTDLAHFTPLWTRLGAHAVLVLTDTAEEGAAACEAGASGWIPAAWDARAIAEHVRQHLPAATDSAVGRFA